MLRRRALQLWQDHQTRQADRRFCASRQLSTRPAFDPSAISSVLVLMAPAIGDIVINYPVVEALKAAVPNAELTVLWGPAGSRLRSLMPAIDREIVLNAPWFDNEKRRGEPGDFLGYLDEPQTQQLRSTLRPDLVVVLNGLLESMHFAYALDAGYRAGTLMGTDPCIPALPRWQAPAPGVHVGDHNMNVLRLLGLSVPASAIPDFAKHRSTLPKAPSWPNNDARKRLLWNPFAASSSPSKRLPAHQEKAVARALSQQGWQVLVIGSPADRRELGAWMGELPINLIDAIGHYALDELAALMLTADAYLGCDTGTTHLAAALGVPTLALFGRLDPRSIGPRGRQVDILRADNPCELSQTMSCTRLHCQHRVCLQAIATDAIIERLRVMMESNHVVA